MAKHWRRYVRDIIGDDRQIDVSRKTGIDQATVSRWLRDVPGDKPPSISYQTVRAFALGYGRDVIEAFTVAGILSEEESPYSRNPPKIDWARVSDEEFAAEFRRRLERRDRR